MLRATVQFRRLQARGGALRRHGGLQLVAPWQVAHRRIASSVGGSQAAAGNGVHDDAKGNHGEPSELEEVKARLSNIDSRLNSLEQALTEALSRQPDQNYLLRKHEAGGRDGPVSSAGRQDERRRIEDPSNIMPVQQAGGGEGDQGGSIKGPGEAVTDGLATLQPKIMSFLNSGYLQAVKELRHALMVSVSCRLMCLCQPVSSSPSASRYTLLACCNATPSAAAHITQWRMHRTRCCRTTGDRVGAQREAVGTAQGRQRL